MSEKDPDERIVEVGEKDPNSKEKIKDNPNINNDDTQICAEGEIEANNIQVTKTFDYLVPSGEDSISFGISYKANNESVNVFQNNEEKEYKYAICILLKDNSDDGCDLLQSTVQALIKNIEGLKAFEIENKDIYIFIFLRETIQNEYLIKKESFKLITKEKQFLKTPLKLKDEIEELKIDLIYQKYNMTDIESLQCFYTFFVKNLKQDSKPLITSVITAGVIPKDDCLIKMIHNSYIHKPENNNFKFGIVVPALDIGEKNKNNDLFLKIAQYERVHFNIYNLNFYCQTAVVPISSLLNTIIIENKTMEELNGYYKNLHSNTTIDYHDYNLALSLYRNLHKVIFYKSEILGTIYYNNYSLVEYRDNWVNKFSGYYGNFFEILKTFIYCGSDIFPKIFMFFQIMGLCVEFIYPSLSALVIYSIFIEAFDDSHSAIFMTLLYLVAYLGSGVCSMITNKSEKLKSTNFFFYIFMEVYYLFILVSSIPAMDNIKKEKGDIYILSSYLKEYKFNIAAFVCLFLFTFILSIIPIILKISYVTNNIVQMFMYLVLGAPSSTSNFLIAKIWKAPETMGGKFCEERKGITVIAFFLFNLFFGFISFFMFNRERRAKCVMSLAIIYLIYLFFKIVGIILPLLSGPESKKISDQTITKALNGIENISLNPNENNLAKSTDNLKNKYKEEENEEKLDATNENENNDRDNDNNNDNREDFKIENNEENEKSEENERNERNEANDSN